MPSLSLATVKGNGTESVISARCTQPFTFPGISLGENSAHQLLISPGTLYCRVDRGTTGWEACPTLLHLIISVPLPALPPATLPPSVKFYWLLPLATVSQTRLTFLATISQTRLTFPCHHQSDTADFSLPPSVSHGWLFLVTSSQTRLTFPCHQCLERLVPLPPMF